MEYSKFKLGSLFSGSGGFELAASLCGIEPVWASEIECYPIAVTTSRFPKMRHLGDISKINGAEIEPVDIISFGSPCQDLSVAGLRKGLKHEDNGDEETTRSGLFMEAIRIIKEMREATNGRYPTFALWENVPGAFSSNKGEDFRTVLEELIKIVEPAAVMPEVPKGGWAYADYYCGDGWSIAYRVLDAQYIRTAQRRRRVFLVLDLGGERARKILFEREGLRGYPPKSGTPWQATSTDAEGSVVADDRARECVGFDSYNLCLTEDNARTICSERADNEHLPCVIYAVDQGGGESGANFRFDMGEARANELVVTKVSYSIGNGQVHDAMRPDKEVSKTLNCLVDPAKVLIEERPIAIDRAFYNQGQNAQYDPQFYEDGTCPTLVAKGPGADCTSKPRYIVRRLTPTECARLQGFPSIVEVDMKDITRDELCAIALAAGYIKVDTENGIVYGTRGPGGIERGTPIELHGSIVNGYKVYSIHAGGVKKQVRAHRLVWIAAHGAIPEGMVVDHINNDKSDNRLCNLQLLTHEQNSTKAREDGCYLVGDDHPGTKIGEKEKRALYFLYWNTDKPYSYYARMFGISDSRAQQIIHEKGWGHPDHKDDFTDEEYRFWLDVRNTHAEINGKAVKEYTKEQMVKWYNKLHTDSAEYNMWGNGVALPCVAYVMEGIVDAMKGGAE